MPDEVPPSIDEVCQKALRLPCSPAVLPRLAAALQSDESSAAQIERLISLDTSLAAATLRLANSAVFGRGTVETLEDAVFRLGAKEIYRLAALVLLGRWGDGVVLEGREPGDFSRQALCTAIAVEVLAEATERIDPQLAYTAGLVADVGRLALGHTCGAFYPKIRTYRSTRNVTWEEAERAILGYHHADVSWRLLNIWNFPPTLVQAVKHMMDPESAPPELVPLLAHLHAARYIALSLGPGVGEESFLSSGHGDFITHAGLSAELLEAAMPTVLERVSARLGDKLSAGKIVT